MSGNRLHQAASPYLLQHKDNPVHWMEWGADALALARQTDRPILLSIGYAACHWCHVMASESFEDPDTAAVMNDLFVNVKVDREERPDVDHLYMSALHALGEQGGWPLTMFLAPDGEPFWGGTYFPKQARFGRPSFVTVLRSIAAAYRDQPSTIRKNTAAIMEAVRNSGAAEARGPVLTAEVLDTVAGRAASATDPINGGLGGAPKFPNAGLIEMLFRAGARQRDPRITDLAVLTLRRISQGGNYDHQGGGFARYSVDARWLVPHFEKMLYDNAQLIELLALAFHHTGDMLFKQRITETVGWLGREMTADGAFCASLDADSEHVEGKFYVWTRQEIAAVLGAEDAAFFGRIYDVTAAGNWHDEHTGQSVTILNRLDTPIPAPEDERRLAALLAELLAARAARIRPGLDDKILTDWNGLAIAALTRAAGICGEPAWLDLAAETFTAVTRLMNSIAQPGDLLHARRGESRGRAAFATDYAAMTGAALALAEARLGEGTTASQGYIEQARHWLDVLNTRYAGPDGILFMTPEAGRDIPLRLAPLADEATPNANGLHAAALVRMAAMTGEDQYKDRADRLFEAAQGGMMRYPLGHCSLFNAFDLHLNGVEIVLAGRQTQALARAALALPYVDRTVTTTALLPDTPLAREQERIAAEGAAFICRGQICSAPAREPDALRAALEATRAS